MNVSAQRLQSRLMVAFAGFALFTAAVFGLYAITFMYVVEDTFFEATLEQEVAAVATARHKRALGRTSRCGHTDLSGQRIVPGRSKGAA